MSPSSSPPFDAPLVLCPRRSRRAWSLWALQLAVLSGAALVVGTPVYVKISALLAAIAYAAWSSPRRESALVCGADGRSSPSRRSGNELVLDSAAVYTRDWAELPLVGTGGRRRKLLLFKDALAADEWRWLQLELREPKWPRAAADERSRRPAGPPVHWT